MTVRSLRRSFALGPLVAWALAQPVLALAQAPAARQPPGGASIAWPLGLIVALVVLVAIAGGLFAANRRRQRSRGGAPPASR